MNSSRVTMHDLAREAGVSQSTISRALQNHPRISEETRQRIRKLARKMGFRPDPALAALTTYRAGKKQAAGRDTLAIVRFGEPPRSRGSEAERKIAGMKRRAEELGYTTEQFFLDPEPANQKRLSRILYNRGIRGLVIGAVPLGCRTLDYIDWPRFAAVTIGYSLESPLLNYVAQDHRTDMAYENLRALGYQRIGYCAALPHENNFRYLKLAEYLKCLYQDGITTDQAPPLFYLDEKSFDPVSWIEKYGFDAVMAANASFFIHRLKGTAYEPPKGLAVAALCMNLDQAIESGISGSIADDDLTGVAVIDQLHQNLCHGQLGVPRHRQAIMLDNTWYAGTTAPGKLQSPGNSEIGRRKK